MLELLLPNSISPEHPDLSLDELAREGAQRLLKKALAHEVADYLKKFEKQRDSEGKRLVTKNGKAKERTVLTGAGELKVQAPRVNDRRQGKKFTKIDFSTPYSIGQSGTSGNFYRMMLVLYCPLEKLDTFSGIN
jgi:hypothetical protein